MHARPATVQPVQLDARRGWARVRAAAACFVGVMTFALSAAGLVMIGFAAAARAWSWATHKPLMDAPVWSWAPGGAEALAALAVLVSCVGAFWHFWFGATRQVIAEVRASPMNRDVFVQIVNVVEALSIGLGRPMPTLYVTDDPAPNAMSLRSARKRVLIVTNAVAGLPRDQIEAMCAHELGHLWADDAHWVTSGMVALARARRFGSLVLSLGIGLLVLVGIALKYTDVVLWSTALVGLLLLGLGFVAKSVLRSLERSVRRHADEIADVVAVKLARNPSSLGAVCATLARNPDRVTPVGWRSELMWFEAVETLSVSSAPSAGAEREAYELEAAAANTRSHAELIQRAVAAYAEARVPLPPEIQALRV